jgi:hypothetical protein
VFSLRGPPSTTKKAVALRMQELMEVTESSAAAETKKASLPCEALYPSDVMRNVTA